MAPTRTAPYRADRDRPAVRVPIPVDLNTGPARKRRRTIRSADLAHYVIEISDWDWDFLFGIENSGLFEGPSRDYRHLKVCGRIHRPEKLATKAATLVFVPSAYLNEEGRSGGSPTGIGFLNLGKDTLEGNLGLPADAVTQILQMLIAGRFQFLVIEGTTMRYREAEVTNYRFSRTFAADDLPPEKPGRR